MTTEYFEQAIEKFKQEGKLPKDFEIAEMQYLPDMEGILRRAVGYALGDIVIDKDGKKHQGYDIYAWTYWSMDCLQCRVHKWNWADDSFMPLSIRWNEETRRPEFVDLIHLWGINEETDVKFDT